MRTMSLNPIKKLKLVEKIADDNRTKQKKDEKDEKDENSDIRTSSSSRR